MAIVWSNSFDGTPGTSVTVANSGNWGDPIAGIRNNAPSTAVRYGDRAVLGRSSLRLGTDAGTPHGDVWLYYPTVNAYSISFYVYLARGSWFRIRDASVITEFYLSSISNEYVLGSEVLPPTFGEDLIDRWVRVDISANSNRMSYRLFWTDIHAPSTANGADHVFTQTRAGGTIGGVFTQGGGSASSPVSSYIDQVRIGEGEWLGPWPTHATLTAVGALALDSHAEVDAEPDDDNLTAVGTLPLSAEASLTRTAQTEAEGALSLEAGAEIVRHATMEATGTIGALAAHDVDLGREGRFDAEATLSLSAGAELRGQFRPTFPPHVTTEIKLDGQWVDISSDVRTSEDITITRGRADEASEADPASCSLLLDNRDGRYSPHNPMSPYYGSLGRNTPMRIRVGPLPEPLDPAVVDDFDRTTTSGWGTTATGQTWTAGTSGPAGTYVANGAAHHQIDTIPRQHLSALNDVSLYDQEATVAMGINRMPRGPIAGAIAGMVRLRRYGQEGSCTVAVSFRNDTGSPDGLRVTMNAATLSNGIGLVGPVETVPGLAYRPGEWLRVRVRAVGEELRARVWPDGSPEPDVWHLQAHMPEVSVGGGCALVTDALLDLSATELPITVSYRDFRVYPVVENNLDAVSRFAGEVSEWPSRWDVADVDVTVPVAASGVLRRLGQGAAPMRSVLRRTVAASYPAAYWPLEDGARTREATSAASGAAPLRVSGFRFGEDSTLATSEPLPTLGPSASMSTQSIPSAGTGSGWEVTLLYRLEQPREDYEGLQQLLSVQTTTDNVRLDLLTGPSGPSLRATAIAGDGTEVAMQQINVTTGTPSFFGEWRRLRVTGTQAGSRAEVRVDRLDEDETQWGVTLSYAGRTGAVTGVSTTFGPQLEGMAIGHLSVWGAPWATAYYNAWPGYDGESARRRITRLSAGAGVPVEVTGAASERLGIEQRGTYLEAISEAQAADAGAPGESRSRLGLTYRGRDQLYHADPALVLDYAAGEISPPMEPVDDDQAIRNDVEVKRQDGASVQVEDLDGPLGVERVGRYDESTTLNLGTDRQAEHHAGWRLHLGTVNELRWPLIRLNLANPRLSARVEDILALDAGDRIRILNPPPWTQAEHLDLIVQGYTERLNTFVWEIELNCTPASPWQVAQAANGNAAPDAPMRADTAGSELDEAIDPEETVLQVRTTRGPAWVTDPAEFPLDIHIGGEVMRVTGVTGTGPVQTFTVSRSINTISKPHPAGAVVRLAHPAVVAL